MVHHLRSAKATDALSLVDIARQAYSQYVGAIGREPAPMTADYARHIQHDDVTVAVVDEHIVGFFVLIQKADDIWLETIAVAPKFSGRGLGTLLVQQAERQAARLTNTLYLYTNAAMASNLDWYPRLGYEKYDERVEDGFERVFFRKLLAK